MNEVCENCGGPILVTIFKGDKYCCVDCEKQAASDASR